MTIKMFMPFSGATDELLKQKIIEAFDFIRKPCCCSVDEFIKMLLAIDNNEIYRRFFIIPDEQKLKSLEPIEPSFSNMADNSLNDIVFMFPGQGLEYHMVGKLFYTKYPTFRIMMDRCFEEIEKKSGYKIKHILYESDLEFAECKSDIQVTSLITFSFQYSFAMLLLSFGIIPTALIGYSIGEYVAATIAGIFSLKDALDLVCLRGELLKKTKPGRMLSVPETAAKVMSLLSSEAISLAADHGDSCVISGAIKDISQAEMILKNAKILTQYLDINRAGHSYMLDNILDMFEDKLKTISFSLPKLPLIATLTGGWQTNEMSCKEYWLRQLRQTVQFDKSIDTLLECEFKIFLEVGIGNSLTVLVAQKKFKKAANFFAINLVKDQYQTDIDEHEFLVSQLGRIWVRGLNIDWSQIMSLNLKCQEEQGFIDNIVAESYIRKLSCKKYYLLNSSNVNYDHDNNSKERLMIFDNIGIMSENLSKLESATIINLKKKQVSECVMDISNLLAEKKSETDPLKIIWICGWGWSEQLSEVKLLMDNYSIFLLFKKINEQKPDAKHYVIFNCVDSNSYQFICQVVKIYKYINHLNRSIQIICCFSSNATLNINSIDYIMNNIKDAFEEKIVCLHQDKMQLYAIRNELFLPFYC